MSSGKINMLQVSMILMLMNGLTDHVIVNPMLLDASGRDSWITVLTTGIWALPWCALLVFIMKKSGQHKLQPWLARQTHPVIAWLLVAPLCIQLYFIGAMTVVHTSIWTVTNYLPATPRYALVLALVLVCGYAAKLGIQAIAISSGILLPTVAVLGYFVAITNTQNKDYQLLKPFLEHGLQPVLHGMIYTGGGLMELIVILLLQHHIRKKVKVWQLLLLALILIYITLGPIIGAITEFGPQEAAKQMVSPYEQWRLVKLGDYIEHVDFLTVYQWLAGASVRVSLAQFLLADVLPLRGEWRHRLILGITVSYFIISMVSVNQDDFYRWMYRIYFPYSLALILLLTFVFLFISLFAKSAKGEAA
ncbi:GerAB/ArcD/ProY family transporter [Paenibacillus sp. y28]|uniref:GerAB/ArcD/ProY family transporter n=1 Tax=Paenibacillus sp. y28 TaxID=3129110 RepID=UPI00301AC85B